MKLLELLKKVKHIAIDTAPLIYFIEENPIYISIVEPMFLEISRGNLHAFTSQITLIEVLIRPLEENNNRLIKRYTDILCDSENLFLSDIDKEIAMESARLRANGSSFLYPGISPQPAYVSIPMTANDSWHP